MEDKGSKVIGGCAPCGIPNFHDGHERFEHNLSLAHHLKLDEQSKSHHHHCQLCQVSAHSIRDYVTHLEGRKHKKKLEMRKKGLSRKQNCESGKKTKADNRIQAKKGSNLPKRKDADRERDLGTKVLSAKSCNGTGSKPTLLREREGQCREADTAEKEVERLGPDGEAEFSNEEGSSNMWQGGGPRQDYWQQWSYQGNYRGYQNHQGYYQQPRYHLPPGYQQQWSRSYGNHGGGSIPPFRGMHFHQQLHNWNKNTVDHRYGGGQQPGGEASTEAGRGGACSTDGWLSSCYGDEEAPKAGEEAALAKPPASTVSSGEKTAERIKREKVTENEESCNSESSGRRDPKSHLIFLSSEEEEEGGSTKKRAKAAQQAGVTTQKKIKGKVATGTSECNPTRGGKGPPQGSASPRTPPTSGRTVSNEAFRKDVLDRLVNFPCSRRLRSQLSKWVTQLKKTPQSQSQNLDKSKSTLTLFSAQKLDLQGLVKEMEAGDLPDELLHSLMSALDEGSDVEHEAETAVCKATEDQSRAKAKESNAKTTKKSASGKSIDMTAKPVSKLSGAKPSAIKAPATKSAMAKPPAAKSTVKPSSGKVSSAKPSPVKPPSIKPTESGRPKRIPPAETSGENENAKEEETEEECVVVPTPAKVVESVELTDSEDDDWHLSRSPSGLETNKDSGTKVREPAPLSQEAAPEPTPRPPLSSTPREDARSRPPLVPRPSSAPTGRPFVPTLHSSDTLPRPVSAPKGTTESVQGNATDLLLQSQEDRKVGEVKNGFPFQQDAGVVVGVAKKEEERGEENPRALVTELIALCQEEEQVRTQCALAQRNIAALKSAIDQWKLKEEELLAREEQMRKKRLHLLRTLQDSVGAIHGRTNSAAAEQARLLEALKNQSRPPLPPVADVAGVATVGDDTSATGVTYLGSLDTTLDIMQQILPHMQQLGDIDTPPVTASATIQDAQAMVPPIQLNLRGNVKRKRSAETTAKTKKTKPSRTDPEVDLDESRLKDIPATLEVKAHEGAVVALKLCKGYVFTCSTDHTAKRFDLTDPSKCIVYGCHSKALSSLEVQAAKGAPTLLYTACRDGCLRCFDADSGERTLELDLESPIGCTAAAWGRLYLGLQSGQVVVFNLKGQQVMEKYTCSEGPVGRLCTAAEGAQRLLCTVAADGRVGVRDAATGLLLRCLGSQPGSPSAPALVRPPACLALAAGFIYTASSDRTIMVHELRTGNLQKVYEAKSSATGMRVYKNYLLCCSFDGLIRCYRLKDFLCDVVYYGAGKNMVMSMDTCGPLIATGNRKGVVELITFDKSSLHPCEVGSCSLQFGREEDLVHHLKREHLAMGAPSVQARCPWQHCNMAFVGPTSSKDFEKHLMDHACT